MNNLTTGFVAELMKQAKFDALPDDARANYEERLSAEVERRIGIIIMSALDEQSQGEFVAMMEKSTKPDPAALERFFKERIPNLEQRIQDGLTEFVREFLRAAQTTA